jgi:hypothetical protein
MKTIRAVNVYIFRKCARCGKEEDPESITRKIDPPITVDEEKSRVTVEVLYDNEENQP